MSVPERARGSPAEFRSEETPDHCNGGPRSSFTRATALLTFIFDITNQLFDFSDLVDFQTNQKPHGIRTIKGHINFDVRIFDSYNSI